MPDDLQLAIDTIRDRIQYLGDRRPAGPHRDGFIHGLEIACAILRDLQGRRHCAGDVLDLESPDRRATKPCPKAAVWVNTETGSPFCTMHKEAIERINPNFAPYFREIEQPAPARLFLGDCPVPDCPGQIFKYGDRFKCDGRGHIFATQEPAK